MPLTQAPSYLDISPETCLRLMDQAVIDWLSTVKCRGQFAKVVTGWNSRNFAQVRQVHDGKPVKQAIPLPMISLTQTLLRPDTTRWTRSRVRMTGIGPVSRSNVTYYSDAVYSSAIVYTGNGTTTAFTGVSLTGVPIRKKETSVTFTISGNEFTETDDGLGAFTDNSGFLTRGYVNYTTGVINLTFKSPPTDLTSITANYLSVVNDNRAQLHCPFPLPITISYNVDIWSKTQQDMRSLRTQILAKFDVHPDLTWLGVTFPNYGEKMLYLELENDTDNSDLEAGEAERELRHTITLNLHGWIFKMPILVKATETINVALIDGIVNDWYCNVDQHFHLANGLLVSIDEDPGHTPPYRTLLTLGFDKDGLSAIGP